MKWSVEHPLMYMLGLALCLWVFSAMVSSAAEYAGKIEKFDMNGLTVHSYNSVEDMLDGSVIFETSDALVLLELQSMPTSAAELKRYIDSLGKPLAAVIVGYHGSGPIPCEGVPVHGSRASVEFAKSGRSAALYEPFAKGAHGFDATVVVPDHIIEGETANIAGIDFALDYRDAPAPGMTIGVPSAKAVYLHMLGGDSHSILGGREHIDVFIGELEKIKSRGYELILTSHHTPEAIGNLDEKIAYLEKTKEILAASKTQGEFLASMKKTFPNHMCEHYLEMSAENLFRRN